MTTIERPSFSDRCFAEATAAPIFLLQWRSCLVTGEPHKPGDRFGPALENDGDGWWNPDTESHLTIDELIAQEAAVEVWNLDSLWLSREEATAFAEGHAYRWPDGWRVYSHPAKGELAELLKGT